MISREAASAGLAGRARRTSLIGLALLIAACAAGGLPETSAEPSDPTAGVAATSPRPSAIAEPAPTLTPGPVPTEVPGPPVALLSAAAGDVRGDLGSFSWDGLVSDSAWIVEPAGSGTRQGGDLDIRFARGPSQATWTARWARITNGAAGVPVAAARGAAGPIVLAPPPGSGSWSLQLEAVFAEGRRGTWYWRVETGP